MFVDPNTKERKMLCGRKNTSDRQIINFSDYLTLEGSFIEDKIFKGKFLQALKDYKLYGNDQNWKTKMTSGTGKTKSPCSRMSSKWAVQQK